MTKSQEVNCNCGRKCCCVSCVVCRKKQGPRFQLSSDARVLSELGCAISERVATREALTMKLFVEDFPKRFQNRLDVTDTERLPKFPEPFKAEELAAYQKRVAAYLKACEKTLVEQRVRAGLDEAAKDSEGLSRKERGELSRRLKIETPQQVGALMKRLREEIAHLWVAFEHDAVLAMDRSFPVRTSVGLLTIVNEGGWVLQQPDLKEYKPEEGGK